MIKAAMQVKALIRNMADGDSDKSQILLRIYMMERFLERVSASKYRDNFILKGGMLISSLVGVDMRTTMDIDTTVRAVPLEKDTARQILDEIIEIDLEDGVQFQVTRSEEIMEGHEYEGLRFFIEGKLDKLRQMIKIDLSAGDAITPRAIEYELPLLLEERTIRLWSYNTETLIAEKMETVIARAEANTRMRDFYDLYTLVKSEHVSIDWRLLNRAFAATCARRGMRKSRAKVQEVLEAIRSSEVMQANWDNYRRSNTYVGDLTWEKASSVIPELFSIAEAYE